jgi:hypothetical protein
VIIFALATAFALLLMGPRVYGYDMHAYMWIQDKRDDLSFPWAKLILYYLEVGCIFVYSLWIAQFYRFKEKGMAETLSNRRSIMDRSKRFVVGHILIDSLILMFEFTTYLFNDSNRFLFEMPAYLTSLQGVLGFIVILYSNHEDLTLEALNPFAISTPRRLVEAVALEGVMQQPHLNTALRAEILYFSTQGITFAAREVESEIGQGRDTVVDGDQETKADGSKQEFAFQENAEGFR